MMIVASPLDADMPARAHSDTPNRRDMFTTFTREFSIAPPPAPRAIHRLRHR
jgi:hypothetical protein